MADHVALMREAAERLRSGFVLPHAGYSRLADLLDAVAHREDEYLAGLTPAQRVDCDPEPGDEAELGSAFARVYLGRPGG